MAIRPSTPIKLTSREYFDIASLLPSEHAEYAKAWLYIARAGRGLGRHLVTEDFYAGLGRHDRNLVVIRPSGELPPNFLEHLASLTANCGLDFRVYVTKAREGMRAQLVEAAASARVRIMEAGAGCGWHSDTPNDGDTHPEVLMNVEDTLEIMKGGGKRAQEQPCTMRSFIRSVGDLQLSDVATVGRATVESMLASHFAPHVSFVDSFRPMLQMLESEPSRGWEHFVPLIDGQPVGLFAYEVVDPDAAGVYACVALNGNVDLAEAMLCELFTRLSLAGVECVNLGGSETEALARHKAILQGPGTQYRSLPIQLLDLSGLR